MKGAAALGKGGGGGGGSSSSPRKIESLDHATLNFDDSLPSSDEEGDEALRKRLGKSPHKKVIKRLRKKE